MGDEGSKHVVDRVAEAFQWIGEDDVQVEASPRGDGRSDNANRTANTAEPVTDGGADGASPGAGPWTGDDPIVFGDESDPDAGTAILEDLSDDPDSAPPFSGDDDGFDGSDDANSGGRVDGERLEELDARIGALESDHTQLESQLADLATGVRGLDEDVDAVADDVRELVTLLGGIALTAERSGDDGAEVDASAVAEELADALDVQWPGSGDGETEADRRDAGGFEPTAAADADGESRDDDASSGAEHVASSDEAAEAATDGTAFGSEAVPEGIHRSAGEPPAGASAQPAENADGPADGRDGDSTRTLVDPRSDAVGARLREFREGFVDDPTEDLPTGTAADEFEFEKILLPTDGEAAPDVSTDELEKPYLESLPDGYAADAVVLEWLDWLVSAADGEAAASAVRYYESIGWLTDDARAALLGYLNGLGEFDDGAAGAADEPPAAFDLQDHLRSLQYVTELATGEVDVDGV